ncbi:hypothetical protein [Halosimplex salinum]|uniref:hypothetical protein n=1 Tax=Halosimplex salinum TaxID=1710538 RepID=UPI000F47DC03|nr:hypothetical protein [Halosimplex salinum]
MLLVVALWALYRGREWLVAAAVTGLVVAAASRVAVRGASWLARRVECSRNPPRPPDDCPCDCESADPDSRAPEPPSRPVDGVGRERRASGSPFAVFYIDNDTDGVAIRSSDDRRERRSPEPDDE